jgi:hypothetical protein
MLQQTAAGSTDDIIGTWNLTTVTDAQNNIPLSYVFLDSITRTFKSDNTFTQVTVLNFLGYTSTETLNGTWSVTNGVYTIIDTTDATNTMSCTIENSTLQESGTELGTTYTFIYTKQ